MKFIDLIKLATRMFRARTSRTFLTILGVGVGMATILFLISLGFGVQEVILNKITTSDSLASIDIFANPEKVKKINWESVEQIKYIKELEKVAPLLKYDGQIKVEEYSSNTSLLITNPGYIGMDGKKIIAGEDLSSAKEDGVVFTSAFLKILGKKSEDLLGKYVEITLQIPSENIGQFVDKKIETKFVVIGIIEDEAPNVYINLNKVKDANLNNISLIKVRTQNFNQVDEAKFKIDALGFRTSSTSEVIDQTKKFFSIASLVLAILGVITLAVSSIGMFNTMVITLLERTEEIGIMKSIGATDRNILSIFIFEAAMIGFLGGVAGVIMGFLAQIIFNVIINFIAVRMGGEAFNLFHSPLWFVISLITVSLLIGIITGLIPARKASVVDPLEALKRR